MTRAFREAIRAFSRAPMLSLLSVTTIATDGQASAAARIRSSGPITTPLPRRTWPRVRADGAPSMARAVICTTAAWAWRRVVAATAAPWLGCGAGWPQAPPPNPQSTLANTSNNLV